MEIISKRGDVKFIDTKMKLLNDSKYNSGILLNVCG
jgi:hypothetical protein